MYKVYDHVSGVELGVSSIPMTTYYFPSDVKRTAWEHVCTDERKKVIYVRRAGASG